MATFNPITGEWEGLEPPRLSTPTARTQPRQPRQPRFNPETSNCSWPTPKRSAFQRANERVQAIGEGIASFADKSRDVASLIFTWILWIAGAIGLISLLLDGHWIIAILLGLMAGALYVNVTAFIAVIAAWLVFLPLAVLRYIFYNIWTLGITTLVFLMYIAGQQSAANYRSYYSDYDYYQEEMAEPYEDDMMYCTASSLTLRSEPSTSGMVCGSLVKGEKVKVLDRNAGNGFSKVSIFGHELYVASRYLSDYEPD